jgi:hypothetical protein
VGGGSSSTVGRDSTYQRPSHAAATKKAVNARQPAQRGNTSFSAGVSLCEAWHPALTPTPSHTPDTSCIASPRRAR